MIVLIPSFPPSKNIKTKALSDSSYPFTNFFKLGVSARAFIGMPPTIKGAEAIGIVFLIKSLLLILT